MGVRAEHYPMAAEALLATFTSWLGEQWTVVMQAAWTEAIVGLMSQGYTSYPAFVSS